MFVLGCDRFPLRVDKVKWVRPRFMGSEGEAPGIPRERLCFSLERTKDGLTAPRWWRISGARITKQCDYRLIRLSATGGGLRWPWSCSKDKERATLGHATARLLMRKERF